MKKKIIIELIIIVILGLGIFFLYKERDLIKPKKEEKQVKKVEKEVKPKELAGFIYEDNDSSFTLKTTQGFYTISKDNIVLDNISLANNIVISYEGSLDSSQDIQDITIKEIKPLSLESLPASWQDEGLFKDYYDQAYQKLKTLSLDEKIGQLFLVRVPESNQTEALTNYHLGGYILFGRDTKGQTQTSLSNTISKYQQASTIPLIIATDEEGGTVTRISNNSNLRSSKFASPRNIYKQSGWDGIKNTMGEMNNLLAELGINVNLAPVADVSNDPTDFIYERAFGGDANQTAEYIKVVLENSKGTSVSNVLKHFPGYGNNKDTHTGISLDERSLDNFWNNDLIPFKTGIENKAEAIMVSHNIIKAVDEQKPASLSLAIHKLARKDLNFGGVLMTDDLDMDAISVYANVSAVTNAILADNDMLIISDYEQAMADVKQAINDNVLNENIINYHAFKVLAWKYYKGLL